MANLPTHLTEKQIADLPWLNSTKPAIAARLDVTGHPAEDIFKFQAALNESGIVTKLHSTNSTTYVVANNESESILSKIRLKHLPLVDGDGLHVHSYKQFDSNMPFQRADPLFTNLHPAAEAGARAENPAAMKSLQKVFHNYGYYGNNIEGGNLVVLASSSNSDLLQEVEAIKGPYNFVKNPIVADSGTELARDGNVKKPAHALSAAETESYYKQFNAKEMPSLKTIAENVINHNRFNISMGALIITADAALAASPALSKGEYADAALLAINSTARLATELIVTAECAAEVATAAAPLSLTPPVYAGAVVTGAAFCGSDMHHFLAIGDAGLAIIEERVKEVAANNGLDPDHIWSSMLEKTKEGPAAPIDSQQAYER
jgi:hypothetical protein